MANRENLFRYAGIILVFIGAILLGLYLSLGRTVNIALPLVFLMLGAAFYFLVFAAVARWRWVSWFFIPGSLLLAFGIVFLLNVITNDWKAWAYAWLLLVAGAGHGFALTARYMHYPEKFVLSGLGVLLGSIALSAIFGVIAGGLFIQILAPILLAAGGLALFWLRPARFFRETGVQIPPQEPTGDSPLPTSLGQAEPLSSREIEVLHLIDLGLTNAEIAERMTVALSTVKTHINNIYGKLGVQTRVQALNKAREKGIIGKS